MDRFSPLRGCSWRGRRTGVRPHRSMKSMREMVEDEQVVRIANCANAQPARMLLLLLLVLLLGAIVSSLDRAPRPAFGYLASCSASCGTSVVRFLAIKDATTTLASIWQSVAPFVPCEFDVGKEEATGS